MEISRVLEETARLVREHAGAEGELPPPDPREPMSASTVRAIVTARRIRADHLGFDVTDAAWSMMLELYAARLEGRRVYQTALGVAAAVPQTTALTAARRLLDRGVFTSAADPDDKRLILLGLSDQAAERMRAYLTTVSRIAPFAP